MSNDSDFARDLIDLLPRLRRFARSLTGRAEEADDLVQSACERALAARDRYEPGTRLDAWMFRIVRNLWIDEIRKRKTAGPGTALDLAEEVAGDDGRRQTDAVLTMASVRDGIATLPPEQREVLTLVCIEDLSYREAAETLAVPIGTVMSRLARARKALGRAIGLDEGDVVVATPGE